MADLGLEIQRTIRHLEAIRDAQHPPRKELNQLLDTLYGQVVELINAAINDASSEYSHAAEEMAEAARQSEEALKDIEKIEHAINRATQAVKAISRLLKSVL